MNLRPRRSALYMPGSNARAMEKARVLPCDAVILDLEDSVAWEVKAAARESVAQAVAGRGYGGREVIVRVNASGTPWWQDDLAAAAAAAPDGIMIPKVQAPADLAAVAERLEAAAPQAPIALWAMIETPLAIINAPLIAAAARGPHFGPNLHLAGFVMGTNDLAKETRVRLTGERAAMAPWLAAAVLAAHAYGIDILDGVYNDIADTEGLRRECVQARDMGFDGKTVIHPDQIAVCNAAFSPSDAEIADARRIIAAFELPEHRNKGVVQIDGRMVERLHADIARRTVALADAIAART